jgi:cholesterol transport system auxiliary component
MSISLTRRVLFAGASALVVAGCADVVGPPSSPKLYMLNPLLSGPLAGSKVGWALSIQMPEASAGFDSDRIALTRPPSGLDYYADAAWADRLPVLVETACLEAFERSGRIAAVARDSDGARADYFLNTDVRDFACRYDAGEGAPLAVVRLGVRVVDARTRKINGTAVFAKEVRAAANSVPAGVAALTEAYGAVLADLVPWVLGRGMPVA